MEVVFGLYWRKVPAVFGSVPSDCESGRSFEAVFAHATAPDGRSQVTLQSFEPGLTPENTR